MSLTVAAVFLASGSAFAAEAEGEAAATPAAAPAAAAPAAEPAAEGKESGLEVGARVGYGIPMGNAAEGSKMSDAFNGKIPLWLDVGYRLNRNIYVGGFFQYGIGLMNDDKCKDCSGSVMRFGVNAQYHIMPTQKFDPWVGVGVGYEIATLSSKTTVLGQTFEASSSTKGLEFINLQAGGDYKVSPDFGIGPFLSFSLGQYSSSTVEINGQENSADIEKKAMHQWLILGVRGSFVL
ncbi:MAG: hypothetical protein HYV09_12305 [Deltaproteobacteria bacterium]|nr:hypothetical protein [Deltaproteobacteria bacterium]